MLNRFLCLLLCLLAVSVLSAQSELNAKSSLPDSLQSLINLAEHNPNADLLYNIGTDFLRLGEVGHANLYFLRALNLNSAHKYARANLEASIRFGSDAKLYPEHLFLVRVLLQVLDFFSVNKLAVLSLICLLGSAIAFLWLLFYDSDKERALPILILASVLLVCIAGYTALGIKSYQQMHDSKAVVLSVAQFYPPSGNTALFEVHPGLVLKVLNDQGSYWLVRLPDGQTGRLKAAAVEKVLR